jgi:hypothetical protein
MGREHGVVLPVRTDPAGVRGPKRRDAAGEGWRRSSHGYYVPSDVPLTPAQRVAEAGILLPRYGAVTGWGSLAWRVDGWFTGADAAGDFRPVPVSLSFHRIRPQPLLHVCSERHAAFEIEVVDGLPVHAPNRAVGYEMRYAAHLGAAAIALNMACFHDLVSLQEMEDWIALHPSYTGIEQARIAWQRGDENAWSPAEVSMKACWCDAGFGEPLSNRPVFDLGGRHLGTPDLIDPRTGVIGEYQSDQFHSGERRAKDLERMHVFAQHGLTPVEMVTSELPVPTPFLMRLRAAYATAQTRPAADRRWTLELPPWWVPTFTVAQRRALSDRDRRIWLRHRSCDFSAPAAG